MGRFIIQPKLKENYFDSSTELHSDGGVSLYPPKMPLCRVTNKTRQVAICPICKSSMIYKYWIQLWGKKRCINKFCRNH